MSGIDDLTVKQAIFCQEYIVDFNATQAAIRSGYSEKTAKEIGCENLTKPNIKQKIDKLIDDRAKRTEITADRVLVELSRLAFADIRDIFTDDGGLLKPSDMGDDIASSVQSVEVVTRLDGEKDSDGNQVPEYVHRIKLSDKKASLELLGKHLKLFTDKVEHTGQNGGPIQTQQIVFNPVGNDKD